MPDHLYTHPAALPCPGCKGPLRDSGPNTDGTLRFVECAPCGTTWVIATTPKKPQGR